MIVYKWTSPDVVTGLYTGMRHSWTQWVVGEKNIIRYRSACYSTRFLCSPYLFHSYESVVKAVYYARLHADYLGQYQQQARLWMGIADGDIVSDSEMVGSTELTLLEEIPFSYEHYRTKRFFVPRVVGDESVSFFSRFAFLFCDGLLYQVNDCRLKTTAFE